MEALKTAYCPGYKALIQIAESGRIGRIVEVEAAFQGLHRLIQESIRMMIAMEVFLSLEAIHYFQY